LTDEPANDEAPASSPVSLGENPEELEFGCQVGGKGVIIKFNTLVQWFDIDPSLAVDFAEAIIDCAVEAATRAGKIIKPRKLH
jgi:hypothetical protein